MPPELYSKILKMSDGAQEFSSDNLSWCQCFDQCKLYVEWSEKVTLFLSEDNGGNGTNQKGKDRVQESVLHQRAESKPSL